MPADVFRPAVRASLPEKSSLRWHDLRHSCASIMLAHGASLLEVKEQLGHATVRTTERYAHLQTHARRDLVARMGAG